MTIEEAIKELTKIPRRMEGMAYKVYDAKVACDMAIEALRFQKKLVRCKDCELRYPHPQNDFCNRHMGKVHDDGFCFEGERRSE